MKQSLADLGYSKQEIGNLKPAYAQLVGVIITLLILDFDKKHFIFYLEDN